MPDNLGPLSDGGLSGVGDSPVVDNAAVGDTQPRSNNADAGPTGGRGSQDGILGRIGSGAGHVPRYRFLSRQARQDARQ